MLVESESGGWLQALSIKLVNQPTILDMEKIKNVHNTVSWFSSHPNSSTILFLDWLTAGARIDQPFMTRKSRRDRTLRPRFWEHHPAEDHPAHRCAAMVWTARNGFSTESKVLPILLVDHI